MQGASKTALMVCAYRARCSRRERPLFVDRWAGALAGDEGEALARAFDRHWPAMEEWMALRVAYLDRLVAITSDRLGVRQVVILGAGYDTRAARLPYAGVRWFEVDHPDTQAAKRERLAALPGYPVDAATYAACDFEREDPVERLRAAGLDPRQATLVIWEGVVPYLTEAAVRATASRLAAGLDPRSLVAFDCVGKNMAEGQKLSARDQETRAFVGDLAEPVRFGSDHLTPLLADCGYRWVRTVSFDDLALQYLGDYRRDRLFRFQRMVTCSPSVPDAPWP
ncbi:MAG: class I SAM-dependent methyltransferase [Kofleriaceae bacterium]|nr:class I SAM-dependent methyltransferase [Kofleriaceae bacterium]MCL4228315.1 SAM-dependent methyltransferase [Myxococcales bacterium]